MNPIKKGLVIAAAAAALTACGGGGGHHNGSPTPSTTGYTGFVKSLLGNTSDTAEPASVNNRDFTLGDQNNPDAYNDVLSPN